MIEEFISYELALEMKELGFNEPCIMQYFYDNSLIFCENMFGRPRFKTNTEISSDSGGDCIAAPTFSQCFKWFRKNYNLYSYIEPVRVEKASSKIKFDYIILTLNDDVEEDYNILPCHTYEEAELKCLKQLVKIVKNEQRNY